MNGGAFREIYRYYVRGMDLINSVTSRPPSRPTRLSSGEPTQTSPTAPQAPDASSTAAHSGLPRFGNNTSIRHQYQQLRRTDSTETVFETEIGEPDNTPPSLPTTRPPRGPSAPHLDDDSNRIPDRHYAQLGRTDGAESGYESVSDDESASEIGYETVIGEPDHRPPALPSTWPPSPLRGPHLAAPPGYTPPGRTPPVTDHDYAAPPYMQEEHTIPSKTLWAEACPTPSAPPNEDVSDGAIPAEPGYRAPEPPIPREPWYHAPTPQLSPQPNWGDQAIPSQPDYQAPTPGSGSPPPSPKLKS